MTDLNQELQNQLLCDMMEQQRLVLPDIDKITKNDITKYSTISLKKKRSRKKFNKNPSRYLPKHIYDEITNKSLLHNISELVKTRINYVELGKKLCMVAELPQDAYARFFK
jgi:hypothetical protein